MELIHIRQTPSTNSHACALIEDGRLSCFTAILADEQTQGRGTRGRNWISLSGNLFTSLCLPMGDAFSAPQRLVYPVALAMAETISALTPQKVEIKWPNDILVEGAKVAGCLAELAETPAKQPVFIAGIGINLAAHPRDIAYAAADLSATGPHDRVAVTQRLGHAFLHWADTLAEQGFEPVRAAYWQHLAFTNERIQVRTRHGETLRGVLAALDEDGALILQQGRGSRKILAGDILPL